MSRVYVLAFVKVNVHVQLYPQLPLNYNLHESKMLHVGGFAALRADRLTAEENDFGIKVEDADWEVDVGICDEGLQRVWYGNWKRIGALVVYGMLRGWKMLARCD